MHHACLLLVCLVQFFSVLSQEIGWEEHLRKDLFCVGWDVKPQLKLVGSLVTSNKQVIFLSRFVCLKNCSYRCNYRLTFLDVIFAKKWILAQSVRFCRLSDTKLLCIVRCVIAVWKVGLNQMDKTQTIWKQWSEPKIYGSSLLFWSLPCPGCGVVLPPDSFGDFGAT